MAETIYRNNYGLGAIAHLHTDPEVSEIWVNGPGDIWVEKSGLRSKYEGLAFRDDADIRRVVDLLCRFDKKEISVTNPIVEAKLADGSRLTALVPPVTDGPVFSLRCPDAFVPTTENMLKTGTMDQGVIDLLTILVRGRANILIIGETGAGKTQFIRWLIGRMRPDLRLITLETRQELYLRKLYSSLNFQALEENPEHGVDLSKLFRTTLRLSPDVIVCGEMRSYEAEAVINAMRRGHPGSLSCLHTTSPEFVVDDVAEMICDDGKSRDPRQLARRISNAVDIVVQINRSDKTGKRRVKRISELSKEDATYEEPYKIVDLYVHNESNDTFSRVGQLRTRALKRKLLYYATGGQNPIPVETIENLFYEF